MLDINCSLEGDLWVVEIGALSGDVNEYSEIKGPYLSKAAAYKAIKQMALESVEDGEELTLGDLKDYCSLYAVVRLESVYHPIPKVTVNMRLKKVL